jgi:hypothetical protein
MYRGWLMPADTVLADLESGEPPILLADLRDEPFMPRPKGRKLDKSVPFRWHKRGTGGIKLDAVKMPTGIATTRSACLRFFAALSGRDLTPQPTPRQRQRQIERAERELQNCGI